jgi:hypothetical protein
MLRRSLTALAVPALLTTACSDRLTPTRALELLRQQPPEPVTLGVADWERLKKDGYLEEHAGRELENTYGVTAAGAAHGLVLVVERGPGSVSVSLRARVCDRPVREVTAVTPFERGATRAADVTFIRRAVPPAAPSPLFPDPDDVATACDSTVAVPERAVFVRDTSGWRINHAPVFAAPPQIETRYEYDPRGVLIGATSTATFAAGPSDPDGDSITLAWIPPRDSTPVPVSVGADGLKLTVDHLLDYGQPMSAHGRLIVTDVWGVADTIRVGVRFR